MKTSRMIATARFVRGSLALTMAAGLGLSPIVTGSVGVDPAFAHPGNGNGAGGNGNGNGAAAGNGHAASGVGTGVGAAVGSSGKGSLSSALGALNAAHASRTALARANAHSRVGRIAAYSRAVQAALANVAAARATLAADQAALAMDPASLSLQAAVTQDQAALAAARTALARTEQTFAQAAANKTVTPAVISALNSLLGLR